MQGYNAYDTIRMRRKSRIRRYAGGFSFVMFLLSGVFTIRVYIGNRNPVISIPPRILPSPNAFDTYTKAARLLVNMAEISDPTDPADTESAAKRYAIVAKNQPALTVLRTGLALGYRDASDRTLFSDKPFLASYRTLARLLALDAVNRSDKGDWAGAARSDLECITFGCQIQRGAPVLGNLVGDNCQSMGRRNLWRCIDHLSITQTRDTITRLDRIERSQTSYVDVMNEERDVELTTLKKIFEDPKALSSGSDCGNGSTDSSSMNPMYALYSKQTIVNSNRCFFAAVHKNAARPYALHLPDPPISSDWLNKIIEPLIMRGRFKHIENETQNDLLRISLALHAYRLAHDRYPEALSMLTPGEVSALPDDPFALSGTFKYRISGARYVLYSVGPDGVDDGGKPVCDLSRYALRHPETRYRVDAESKGDLVAGINR